MSRSLEARIAKLEAITAKGGSLQGAIVIRLVKAHEGRPVGEDGELRGYSNLADGQAASITLRKPGEADESLLDRATLAVRRPGSIPFLVEIRA